MMKKKRTDYLETLGNPSWRFMAGLFLTLPLILERNLIFKSITVFFAIFLTLLSGKKIRWFYFLWMTLIILFFHLLLPFGELLWKIGSLKITKGALDKGLSKALTLNGLLFFSLATVTPHIRIPGHVGQFIGRVFYYFSQLTEIKKILKGQSFLSGLDRILFRLYPLGSIHERISVQDKKTLKSEEIFLQNPFLNRGAFFWIGLTTLYWGFWISWNFLNV